MSITGLAKELDPLRPHASIPQIKGGSVLADTDSGDWWGLWGHHTSYRTDL